MKEAYASAKSDVFILNTLEITHPATASENNRLDVCIVLDTSGSMGGQIDLIKSSLAALLTNLLVEFEVVRFSLISYGQSANDGQPIFQSDFTTNPATITAILDTLTASGGDEPVFDAISLAVSSMSWNRDYSVTRAIALFTDEDGEGVSDGNTTTQEETQALLDSRNYILHQTYTSGSSGAIAEMMTATGGVYVNDGQAEADFVEDMTEALKTRRVIDSGIEPYYLVQAVEDYELPLELGADPTTFEAVGFSFKLPGQNDQGLQELGIEIDNVDRRIGDFIRAVAKYQAPVIVRYRPYLSSDLSEPQLSPPLELVLSDVLVTETKVTGRATFADIINLEFLNQNYTRRRFPSLGNT